MPAEPIHRLHKVPDEDQWRGLFDAWHKHLEAVWKRDNNDAPWGYSERTNVGLLASANDKDGGVSMVEVPFRRRAGQADEGAGRYDLWLARDKWELYAEAKQAWVPTLSEEHIDHVAQKLDEAMEQVQHLSPVAAGATIATLVFVVPYPTWTSATTPESVLGEFREFESKLWDSHDKRSPTFQTSFTLPHTKIKEHQLESHTRPRAFPGVILCGRIHQTGAA